MDKLLKQFYGDEHLRLAVEQFLISYVEQEALKALMEKKDTVGFADARDILTKAFINLHETYAPDPKPRITNSR